MLCYSDDPVRTCATFVAPTGRFISESADLLNDPIKINVTITVIDNIGEIANKTPKSPSSCNFVKHFKM